MSVEVHGARTFEDCYNLKQLTFPHMTYCFNECNKLKIIAIPPSVKNVESNAFSVHPSLLLILSYIKNKNFDTEIFRDTPNAALCSFHWS